MNNSVYVALYKNVEYKLSRCVDNPNFQYLIVHRLAENRPTIISVNLIFDKLTGVQIFINFLSIRYFLKKLFEWEQSNTPHAMYLILSE